MDKQPDPGGTASSHDPIGRLLRSFRSKGQDESNRQILVISSDSALPRGYITSLAGYICDLHLSLRVVVLCRPCHGGLIKLGVADTACIMLLIDMSLALYRSSLSLLHANMFGSQQPSCMRS